MTWPKIASNLLTCTIHGILSSAALHFALHLASPSEATEPSVATAGQWVIPYCPLQEKHPDAQSWRGLCDIDLFSIRAVSLLAVCRLGSRLESGVEKKAAVRC